MKIGNIEVYGIIYKIRNTINNKIYIGQSVDGFNRRYKNNIISYTHNNHLKSSILKYGLENFEVIKVFDVAFSKEELDIKEKLWINSFNSTNVSFGYNKTSGGNSVIFTEESKQKMSKAHRLNWSNSNFRKRTIEKLRIATSTKEYRAKMSLSLKNSNSHKTSCNSNSFKNKQRELKLKLWSEEEYRNKVIESINSSWDETRRKSASEIMKNRYKDKNYKENIANSFKKRWQDEEQREKLCNSMKKSFLLIDTVNGEKIEFLGRKELASYIGKSESYIKKYMSKKLLHNNRYMFIRKDKLQEVS